MPVNVAKITQARQAARDTAKNSSLEERSLLEMQYIADSLEAIRVEMIGLSHLVGSVATRGELLKQIEPAPGSRSDRGRATTRGSRK
jgi:hypothetical protein